jgi:hypothetical protein
MFHTPTRAFSLAARVGLATPDWHDPGPAIAAPKAGRHLTTAFRRGRDRPGIEVVITRDDTWVSSRGRSFNDTHSGGDPIECVRTAERRARFGSYVTTTEHRARFGGWVAATERRWRFDWDATTTKRRKRSGWYVTSDERRSRFGWYVTNPSAQRTALRFDAVNGVPIECEEPRRSSSSAEFVLPARVTVITTRRVRVPRNDSRYPCTMPSFVNRVFR